MYRIERPSRTRARISLLEMSTAGISIMWIRSLLGA